MAGKSWNDRVLASKVRTKALEDVFAVLNDNPISEKWSQYKKELLRNMSHSLLPRLNELTGEGGKELFPKPIYGGKSKKK